MSLFKRKEKKVEKPEQSEPIVSEEKIEEKEVSLYELLDVANMHLYTSDLPNLATNGHKINLKELHVLTNPENLKFINPQNIDFEHMSMGEAGMFHHCGGFDYKFHNKQLDVIYPTYKNTDKHPDSYLCGKCIWSSDPTVEVTPTLNVLEIWAKEKGIL